MNPTAPKLPQIQQQQAQQFTPQHHDVYEKLRQVLMSLHQQGIPGIDEVLNSLNKQHVKMAGQQGQQKMGPMPSNVSFSQ